MVYLYYVYKDIFILTLNTRRYNLKIQLPLYNQNKQDILKHINYIKLTNKKLKNQKFSILQFYSNISMY